jgi:methionyl-tRNA formyltransferase
MKILFLGNKDNNVYKFLTSSAFVTKIFSTEKKVSPDQIAMYDFVISYGYRHILKKSHIESSKNPIVNLHISYLPWNRGAHPNYWSWVEATPKGITIHEIDEGVDTGDILLQKKVNNFTKEETLSSSYNKLKNEIENLFIENFFDIINKKIVPKKQIGKGTFHYKKDLPNLESWDIKVKTLVKRGKD